MRGKRLRRCNIQMSEDMWNWLERKAAQGEDWSVSQAARWAIRQVMKSEYDRHEREHLRDMAKAEGWEDRSQPP